MRCCVRLLQVVCGPHSERVKTSKRVRACTNDAFENPQNDLNTLEGQEKTQQEDDNNDLNK